MHKGKLIIESISFVYFVHAGFSKPQYFVPKREAAKKPFLNGRPLKT